MTDNIDELKNQLIKEMTENRRLNSVIEKLEQENNTLREELDNYQVELYSIKTSLEVFAAWDLIGGIDRVTKEIAEPEEEA